MANLNITHPFLHHLKYMKYNGNHAIISNKVVTENRSVISECINKTERYSFIWIIIIYMIMYGLI